MMKVKEGEYIPDVEDTFPEEDPFVHKLTYENIYNEVFDENYPYIDKSWKWKLGHFWASFRFYTVCKWVNPLIFGVRNEGKENLKKHKKELKTKTANPHLGMTVKHFDSGFEPIRLRDVVPIHTGYQLGVDKVQPAV